MKSLIRSLSIFARRFARDRRGATAIIFALAIVPIVGVMGFAIDVGNAIRVQHALQAATDAAALAGAQSITKNTSSAIATGMATEYSSAAGRRNVIPHTTATANVTLRCFNSTGASCAGLAGSNGMVVEQTATVPTYFAKIFGINSIPVRAIATAGAAGAAPAPLNVMIVLDASGSMNDNDPHCGNVTKLKCALTGAQTLLGILVPSVNQVGFMVFPAVQNNAANIARATDCNSGTNPTAAAYSATPASRTYELVALSQDFRASDTATSLASGSSLVNAVGGGPNCAGGGIRPISGMDTHFADAIWQAQTKLVATGQSGAQNVIVLLSDGDANSDNVLTGSCPPNSSVWCTTNQRVNQCRNAVKAADAAAAAGTWVFSIAYDSKTAGTPTTCKYDSPGTDACTTMRNIASDNSKFFSDSTLGANPCTSTQTSLANLIEIFRVIGQALQQPRLLANRTQ